MPILIHPFFSILPAALYLVLTAVYLRFSPTSKGGKAVSHALLLLAIISHGWTLYRAMFGGDGMHFGFAEALSLMLWLAVLFYFLESFYSPIGAMQTLIMPIAALCAVAPAIYPGQHILQYISAPGFRLHFLVAMLAYSLFTLAALHALVMAYLERRLHGGRPVTNLPPLLSMEAALFRLIGLAFILLTITLVSGIFFSEQVFGKPLPWSHKTVFAIASWVVFGILLIGRHWRGWRGKIALRWTLGGFVCLLLAYVGTRFVLEVLLGRVS